MAQPSEVDSLLGELPPTTLLLISGPPLTGKYELLLRVLAEHTDRVVFISTKHQTSRLRSDYRAIAGDLPDDSIGVVDCVSQQGGHDDVQETDTVKLARSPDNLTRIGVKFTSLFERFNDPDFDGHTGVGVHSLSQLLMHADLKKVYQFLQVLSGQVRNAGWFGAAVMDVTGGDSEERETLYHHFDGVLETRESDAGDREVRLRGLGPRSSDWISF